MTEKSSSPPLTIPYSDYQSLLTRYQSLSKHHDQLVADLQTKQDYQLQNNALRIQLSQYEAQIAQFRSEQKEFIELTQQLSLHFDTIQRLQTDNTQLKSHNIQLQFILDEANQRSIRDHEEFQHTLNVCAMDIDLLKDKNKTLQTVISEFIGQTFDPELASLANDIAPRCGELVRLLERLKDVCESRSGSSLSVIGHSGLHESDEFTPGSPEMSHDSINSGQVDSPLRDDGKEKRVEELFKQEEEEEEEEEGEGNLSKVHEDKRDSHGKNVRKEEGNEVENENEGFGSGLLEGSDIEIGDEDEDESPILKKGMETRGIGKKVGEDQQRWIDDDSE
jgi:hypothetical protein